MKDRLGFYKGPTFNFSKFYDSELARRQELSRLQQQERLKSISLFDIISGSRVISTSSTTNSTGASRSIIIVLLTEKALKETL